LGGLRRRGGARERAPVCPNHQVRTLNAPRRLCRVECFAAPP
jgi:hypothetical protein